MAAMWREWTKLSSISLATRLFGLVVEGGCIWLALYEPWWPWYLIALAVCFFLNFLMPVNFLLLTAFLVWMWNLHTAERIMAWLYGFDVAYVLGWWLYANFVGVRECRWQSKQLPGKPLH
jgi:hypothetical protein